ncbi:Longitudinals lacking protein, isoforms J/P/Q/S/Z [Harpegnathos saltator]|uniref:Longitudinals lacking protein, isoforms J/P/Q/S/Z n=1 Tax=Harpegnathos saltator TaxID=610380 RepID=E2BJB8_HARSA|nr:Longitudinals lacking protein, isoforms J/P/Q/S/Z [Harpegnathos saltator]
MDSARFFSDLIGPFELPYSRHHACPLKKLKTPSPPKQRLFCDKLPRDVWKVCKDNLQCLKCEKRYSDWRSLRKHMNYFCNVEPMFSCPYCSHKARLSTLLKYHICREHMCYVSVNQKPNSTFRISVRIKTFVHKLPQRLASTTTAIRVRRFVRSMRFPAFPSNTPLRLDAVTKSEDLLGAEHSGKPLFVCPKCGKGYSWKASLQRHLSTVCGTPPMLFCNLCGYKSSRKDVLFRHMRHVHPKS